MFLIKNVLENTFIVFIVLIVTVSLLSIYLKYLSTVIESKKDKWGLILPQTIAVPQNISLINLGPLSNNIIKECPGCGKKSNNDICEYCGTVKK